MGWGETTTPSSSRKHHVKGILTPARHTEANPIDLCPDSCSLRRRDGLVEVHRVTRRDGATAKERPLSRPLALRPPTNPPHPPSRRAFEVVVSKCRKTEAASVESLPTDDARVAIAGSHLPSPIRMCIISDLLRAVTWRRLPPVQPHGPDGLFVGNAGGIPAGWEAGYKALSLQVEPSPRRLSGLVPRVLSRLSEPALCRHGWDFGSVWFACCCRDVPSLRAQLPGRGGSRLFIGGVCRAHKSPAWEARSAS